MAAPAAPRAPVPTRSSHACGIRAPGRVLSTYCSTPSARSATPAASSVFAATRPTAAFGAAVGRVGRS